MRKAAVILLLASSASLGAVVTYSQTTIRFHLRDGSTRSFTIDSVHSIRFTGNPNQNPQYTMKLYPDTGWGSENYNQFTLGTSDSMNFWTDTLARPLINDWFKYDAGYGRMHYLVSAIDSITVFPRFPQPLDTNYNVVEVSGIGAFRCPIWTGNRIYTAYPLYSLDIDSGYHVTQDSELGVKTAVLYLAINKAANRLLATAGLNYASSALFEVQLDSGNKEIRIDTEKNISSALYYGSGNDSVIFYTLGSPTQDAGYYLFDRKTGKETLILKYLSGLGPWEMVNGFDISPDGKKLLVPVARAERELPIVFEYDMTTGTFDTLNIQFDTQYIRPALWLRYNRDGSKILYDNYPTHSFYKGDPAANFSQIGIIDRKTLTTKRLRTNPPDIYVGLSLMPEWSPDETKIVYGCGGIMDNGTVEGNFRVCILKTLQ